MRYNCQQDSAPDLYSDMICFSHHSIHHNFDCFLNSFNITGFGNILSGKIVYVIIFQIFLQILLLNSEPPSLLSFKGLLCENTSLNAFKTVFAVLSCSSVDVTNTLAVLKL